MLGVELTFVHDARDAMGERRDDAVGGAGHPARVRRAPEHILGMQVERIRPGHVVGENCLVHMDGPLRGPGRAAREMEQGHVLGVGRSDGEGGIPCTERFVEIHRVGSAPVASLTDDQHPFQAWQ